MNEYDVTLSLTVDADNITDAIEEFRHDARYGTDYVYRVDTGDALYNYDTADSTRTEVVRLDKGTLDARIDALVDAVRDLHRESFPYRDHYERVAEARAELYKLIGF
jgi:hypothetical protein